MLDKLSDNEQQSLGLELFLEKDWNKQTYVEAWCHIHRGERHIPVGKFPPITLYRSRIHHFYYRVSMYYVVSFKSVQRHLTIVQVIPKISRRKFFDSLFKTSARSMAFSFEGYVLVVTCVLTSPVLPYAYSTLQVSWYSCYLCDGKWPICFLIPCAPSPF